MAPPAALPGPPSPIQQKPLPLARLPSALPLRRYLLGVGPPIIDQVLGRNDMGMRLSRFAALAVGVVVLGAGLVSPSLAETWPTRSLHFFVPFPAGGSSDAVARAMQPAIERILGQSVVVENRAGAGGMLGV